MFGRVFSFLFILSFLFLIGGCAKPNYQTLAPTDKIIDQSFITVGLMFSLKWEQEPIPMRYESFLLKFYSESDPTRSIDPPMGLQPYVQLWMSSMNHGTSPVQIEKLEEGLYRVHKIWFSMPGEWDLRIQLKEGNIVREQVVLGITL